MIDINNRLAISSFLNFGYDVTYQPDISFNYAKNIKLVEKPDHKLTKDIFLTSIERSIKNSNGNIIVPMSGGLDSRALLAGLLEVCSAERLKTYTFGSKSSYDFEIGVGISKEFGIECTGYELSEYGFSEETLLDTANMFDRQTSLFYHPPYQHIKEKFQSDLFLIGFMGDPLAGSHLPQAPSAINEDVYKTFCKKNQMVRSCELLDINPNMMSNVLPIPDSLSKVLTKEEYCDFEIRQLRYVYPHVMPKGLNCTSPFIDQAWFDHMLSVPNSARWQQSYYNEFLMNAFPKAFNYPCKNNYGLKLGTNKTLSHLWRGMHRFSFLRQKTINYQNFNKRICEDKALYDLMYSLLNKLDKRELSLKSKPLQLLTQHTQGNPVFADAIINLASLEINLTDTCN
jgi:hypothetical protein